MDKTVQIDAIKRAKAEIDCYEQSIDLLRMLEIPMKFASISSKIITIQVDTLIDYREIEDYLRQHKWERRGYAEKYGYDGYRYVDFSNAHPSTIRIVAPGFVIEGR